MIDVCGNDGAAARDFGADEFGCYLDCRICTECQLPIGSEPA